MFQLILDAKVFFLRLYVEVCLVRGNRGCASFGGRGMPRFMIVLNILSLSAT